jgi:hypothetical protein
MKYGYARVSSRDQDLSIQEAALKAAGCDLIRAEKVSGTRREGRAELDLLLEFLRPGDELVVTRIDRLARSIGDLQDIVRMLQAKGVTFRATEQPVDTATAAGKFFLTCWACSRNLKPTCGVNASLRASPEPRPLGSTRAARPRSRSTRSSRCEQGGAHQPRSPKSCRSQECPSIGL